MSGQGFRSCRKVVLCFYARASIVAWSERKLKYASLLLMILGAVPKMSVLFVLVPDYFFMSRDVHYMVTLNR